MGNSSRVRQAFLAGARARNHARVALAPLVPAEPIQVTTTELNRRYGAITADAASGQDYIVTKDDRPMIAVIDIRTYDRLKASESELNRIRWERLNEH